MKSICGKPLFPEEIHAVATNDHILSNHLNAHEETVNHLTVVQNFPNPVHLAEAFVNIPIIVVVPVTFVVRYV